MIEHHRQHGDSAKPIDFRPVCTRGPGSIANAHRLPRLFDTDALCHFCKAIEQVISLYERGRANFFPADVTLARAVSSGLRIPDEKDRS